MTGALKIKLEAPQKLSLKASVARSDIYWPIGVRNMILS